MTAGSSLWARNTAFFQIADAVVHGQIAAMEARARGEESRAAEQGDSATALALALGPAWAELLYRGDTARALGVIEAALHRYPLARIAPRDRPYDDLAGLYSLARRPDLTAANQRSWEQAVPEGQRRGPGRHVMDARLAFARRDYVAAAAAWRAFNDAVGCVVCGLYELGRTYDVAGQADSAIAVWQRAVSLPDLNRMSSDQGELAPTLKRLGELYERRGDRQQALDAYARFVELWKDADPEFQPVVAAVHQRIERLTSERAPS
jgi:tetratricopeptide (TPR) repeat protein